MRLVLTYKVTFGEFYLCVSLGILKVPPHDQQLFNKDNQMMEDDKTLQDYGLTSSTAKAQSPAAVGLALR